LEEYKQKPSETEELPQACKARYMADPGQGIFLSMTSFHPRNNLQKWLLIRIIEGGERQY
jgi:hypothetical protein